MWYLLIYPYIQIIGNFILGIFNGITGSTDNDAIMISEVMLLVITYIIAVIVSIAIRKKSTAGKVLAVKLAHIPFYVGIFILGAIMLFTVMGAPISLALVVADIFMIIPSGIYMTGVKEATTIEKILGFVFVADVIAAMIIWQRSKKNLYEK